jgi:hypothetical protein
VYRYSGFADLRFPVEFMVGEDLTFALRFIVRSSRIVFSPRTECVSGRGIHIFQNSSWDTSKGIWLLQEAMRWRKWLPTAIDMNNVEKEQNLRQIQNLRVAFIVSLLHQFLRMRGFKNMNVVRFVKADPAVLLDFVPVTLKLAWEKARMHKSGW